jgi:fructokinase
VINILDPDAVVIGGGVGNIDLLYEESTRHGRPQAPLQPLPQDRVSAAPLGDSAGVFGAAMLSASSRS